MPGERIYCWTLKDFREVAKEYRTNIRIRERLEVRSDIAFSNYVTTGRYLHPMKTLIDDWKQYNSEGYNSFLAKGKLALWLVGLTVVLVIAVVVIARYRRKKRFS